MSKSETLAPVSIRNTKRAQWFVRFRVTDEEAALIPRNAEGVSTLTGVEVVDGDWREPGKGNGKPKTVQSKICTIALGDREAHTDKGEIEPEITIPGELWAACEREPTQWRTVQGLIDKGEIAIYRPRAAA